MSRLAVLARVERRPNPADWPDDEPMTLKEIIAVFYPDGPLTVASLRSAISAGRLTPSVVAGKHFITPAQLRALFTPLKVSRPCPAAQKDRASISAPAGSTPARASPSPTSTTSGTDRLRSAQAAAQSALGRLSKPLQNTSPRNGPRTPQSPSATVTQLRPTSQRS